MCAEQVHEAAQLSAPSARHASRTPGTGELLARAPPGRSSPACRKAAPPGRRRGAWCAGVGAATRKALRSPTCRQTVRRLPLTGLRRMVRRLSAIYRRTVRNLSACSRHDAQVTPTTDVARRAARHPPRRFLSARHRPSGLPYRFSERDQVVGHGGWRGELALVANQLPAARSSQAACVPLAQVVRVRFGVRGQGTDHCGGVGVHVGQCGNGHLGASVSRAAPGRRRPHGACLSYGVEGCRTLTMQNVSPRLARKGLGPRDTPRRTRRSSQLG